MSETEELLRRAATDLANAKRVVVFTGAGMSADSGVATFRGQGNGIWNGFIGNLALVYFGTPVGWKWTPSFAWRQYAEKFYKPIAEADPNEGHDALFKLELLLSAKNGREDANAFTVITMNVDGFHQRAGSSVVHEVHGTVMRHRCVKNGHPMDFTIDLNDMQSVPKCQVEGCSSTARPDCVLFTESLPMTEWGNAYEACNQMTEEDVILVIGTSNKVYPAAGLPEIAERRGAKVYNFDIEYQRNLSNQILGRASVVLPRIVELVEEAISKAD